MIRAEITQLLYVSVANRVGDDDLKRIEECSTIYNALNGITGLLCFDGVRFMQLLEGKDDRVSQLLENLRNDTRHRDLAVWYRLPQQFASYGEWQMRCVPIGFDGDAAQDIERLLAPSLPTDLAALMRQFADPPG